MSPATDGQLVPIDERIAELRMLGILRYEAFCYRCVNGAVALRFHMRSGWLPVCETHTRAPSQAVEETVVRRRRR